MKRHVRKNFDASPAAYETYETRTRRFEELADRLGDKMRQRSQEPIERVLDAGAGSGASTHVLKRAGWEVVPLDISRSMLRKNRTANRIQADFDHLPFTDQSFDGVAFTASLFLTPEPKSAIAEAGRVIRPDGIVGAVAPLGWTTPEGTDVFETIDRESRSPTATEDVEAALRAEFDVTTGDWSFETTGRNLRLFHAVPAMAARLYPRSDPEARVEKTIRLLAAVDGPLYQEWRWFLGVRDERE